MRALVRTCGKWIFVFAALGAAGAVYVGASYEVWGRRTVAVLTDKTKTVCVGRFLIDLPEDAKFTLKMANLDGFDITRQLETAEQFARWLFERETKLGETLNMLGHKNVELSKEIRGPDFSGRIFVHSRYRSYDVQDDRRVYHETVTIEGHLNKNGQTYRFYSEGDQPGRIAVAASMMRQLVSLRQDELSTAPGFCLDGALIAGTGGNERHESVTMFASLPGHPDLALAFWMNTGLDEGKGLLERDAASTDAFTRVRSQTLRAGTRTIRNLEGEEVGVRTIEMNFTTNFSFAWETRGSTNNILVPRLLLELDTGISPHAGGKPVQSSLSEEAAVQLWDRVLSSVRIRPTVPSKANEASTLPLLGPAPAASTGVAAYPATR